MEIAIKDLKISHNAMRMSNRLFRIFRGPSERSSLPWTMRNMYRLARITPLQQGVMFKNPLRLDRTHSGLRCKIRPGGNRHIKKALGAT
jgi:hypothetical protein